MKQALIAIAFALALVAVFPARADGCPPEADHLETIARHIVAEPEITTVRLSPHHAAALVAFVNDIEPRTDWTAKEALLIYSPRKAAVIINIGGDCGWTSGWRSHGYVERLMRTAQGA